MSQRVAAFLDRDGTLIDDAHYLAEADGVHLLPGAPESVLSLNAMDVLVIVVTNQSGIALGRITEAQYDATRRRLSDLMRQHGAVLDATYHCPHHPSLSGVCDCRKPGTGLFQRAARDFDIDLTRSLFVGDRRRDVEPALELGGVGVLVPSPETAAGDTQWAREHASVMPTLGDAVRLYLALARE